MIQSGNRTSYHLSVDVKIVHARITNQIDHLEMVHSWIFKMIGEWVRLDDLDYCTSLGGINIRMLGFGIQVRIYTF